MSIRLYTAGSVLVLFVVVAIFGPMLFPFDPVEANLRARLLPPWSVAPDGSLFVLGTDGLGRDVLGQIVDGARVSLAVAATTVLVAAVAGTGLGLAAGYFGGPADTLVMRVADVQLAVPPILLAITLVAVLDPGILTVIVALTLTRWVVFARVARSCALVTREQTFVEAARAIGVRSGRMILFHIAPFAVGPLIVVATLQVGQVVLAEAALSFLGLGTSPLQPTWGQTMAAGRDYLGDAWWISAFPGVALSAVLIAVATVGDELRDRLDPRLGRSI